MQTSVAIVQVEQIVHCTSGVPDARWYRGGRGNPKAPGLQYMPIDTADDTQRGKSRIPGETVTK